MKRILRIGRGVKMRRARVKGICDQGLNGMDIRDRVMACEGIIGGRG
ncbi:MAG: hypothetical protein ABSH06_26155 [Thermodesulfobacteriota bacterium]